MTSGAQRQTDPALVRKIKIETHYAQHRYFIAENQILDNLHRLPKVPVTIIHGQLDKTCLPTASRALAAGIANSEFIQLADTGHLIEEANMIAALVDATDRFIKKLN
jgi:proline iminopeptidase